MLLISSRKLSRAATSTAIVGALCIFAACNSTTGSDSSAIITVTSPAAGSSWIVGDSLAVKWSVKQDPVKVVDAADIYLSADSGKSWAILNVASIPPESSKFGNYKWLIPDSLNMISLGYKVALKGAKNCRVKVMEYSTQDPDLIAITGDFTIN